MGRRKLLLCSYDFLVRSMSTLDKNEGGFRGAPYFGAVPPNSYGTPPLIYSTEKCVYARAILKDPSKKSGVSG